MEDKKHLKELSFEIRTNILEFVHKRSLIKSDIQVIKNLVSYQMEIDSKIGRPIGHLYYILEVIEMIELAENNVSMTTDSFEKFALNNDEFITRLFYSLENGDYVTTYQIMMSDEYKKNSVVKSNNSFYGLLKKLLKYLDCVLRTHKYKLTKYINRNEFIAAYDYMICSNNQYNDEIYALGAYLASDAIKKRTR